ncbi:unnamed protein product [Vitrella brassicaformis CCMP3155]|uniref:Uncharacterized protein n=1 Tax=Vitrella brassicaformis (strain CCMP3155) TaxID=1169540 RepID=A0A0G4G1E5_VITBC|nr:unnamed protein product [Vitrella brassicaformis CCMP3155]|eukprot:CEM21320.1 unnamed protein product [Vitrella brassicaformis CCMP3155]
MAADLLADGQKMAGMETAIKQLVMQFGVSSTSPHLDDFIKVGVAAAAFSYDMAMRATADIVPEAVADVQETTADSMRSLDDTVTHLGHKHEQLLGGVTHAVVNLTKVAIHQDTRLDAVERKAVQGRLRIKNVLQPGMPPLNSHQLQQYTYGVLASAAPPPLPPFDTRSFACFAVGSRSRDVIIHFSNGDLATEMHTRMEMGYGLQLHNGVPLMLPAPSTPARASPSMQARPPSVPTRPSRPRAPPMPAMSPASASMPSGGYMAPPPAPVPYAPYIQPLSSCAPPAPQPGPYAPHPQLFPSNAAPAPQPANAPHPMLAPITEELTEEQLDELNREGEIFSRSASSRSLASMRTATSLPGPYPPHKPGVMSTWDGLNAPGVPRFRHQR